MVVNYDEFALDRRAIYDEIVNFMGAPIVHPITVNSEKDNITAAMLATTFGNSTSTSNSTVIPISKMNEIIISNNNTRLLPTLDLERDYRPHADKERHEGGLDKVVEGYLREFYRPYNNHLADLLGESWRNVW